MTDKNREKLIFVTGMLEGIGWCVQEAGLGEAIESVREQIEEVVKEESECP